MALYAQLGVNGWGRQAGIYTDNHQLLSGLPTQRYTMEDRRHIDELLVEAIRVARLRGLDIPPVLDVTPTPTPEALAEASFADRAETPSAVSRRFKPLGRQLQCRARRRSAALQ